VAVAAPLIALLRELLAALLDARSGAGAP